MRVLSKPRDETVQGVHYGLARVLNGNIEYGSPDDTEHQNIRGSWWTGVSPATPDTDFSVAHTLGKVPTGWQVFNQDKPAHVYAGSKPWTNTQIFLRTDQASVQLTVFVV